MMNPGKLQCTMSVQNNIYFPPALVQSGSRQQAAARIISQPPGIRGESEKVKTYWIFKNEPKSEISEYTAESKREALKMYNAEHNTDYKIKKEKPYSKICIVEKTAYLHYNFRMFSYAE